MLLPSEIFSYFSASFPQGMNMASNCTFQVHEELEEDGNSCFENAFSNGNHHPVGSDLDSEGKSECIKQNGSAARSIPQSRSLEILLICYC